MDMCRFHCGPDDREYQKVVRAFLDDILLNARRQRESGEYLNSVGCASNVGHGPYLPPALGQSMSSASQYQHNNSTDHRSCYLPVPTLPFEQSSAPSTKQHAQLNNGESMPGDTYNLALGNNPLRVETLLSAGQDLSYAGHAVSSSGQERMMESIDKVPRTTSATRPRSATISLAYENEGIEDIRPQGKSTIDPKEYKSMVGLLNFPELGARMHGITNQIQLQPAHAQTRQWFLISPQYTAWKSGNGGVCNSGFLWIKGKPGTGKSTLMKYLYSIHSCQEDCTVLAFFFNARGAELEKSTLGCFRTLLFLLLDDREDLWKAIGHINKAGRSYIANNGWNMELLTETFKNAVELAAKQQPVECWIDALDECQDSEVEQMVSFFEDLDESIQSKGFPFRVCFASRHYPNIVAKKAVQVVLEEEPDQEVDIAKYIAAKLRLDDYIHKSEIESTVLKMSSNIFFWVVLVIPILNQAYARGRIPALRKCLEEIPPDLDALFRSILTRDEEDLHELLKCLQWILYSIRPLNPWELHTAIQLSVRSNSSGHFSEIDPQLSSRATSPDDEMSTKELQYYVNSVSKGLAEITTSSTVQFIHESVGDFLRDQSGRSDLLAGIKGFHFGSPGDIHESLKQACLDYIIKSYSAIFPDDSSDSLASSADLAVGHNIREYTFLQYAVTSVLRHADEAYCRGISQSEFLHDFPIHKWTCLYNAWVKDEDEDDSLRLYNARVTDENDEDNDHEDEDDEDEEDSVDYEPEVFKTLPSILYLLAHVNAHHLLRDHSELHQQFKLCCGGLGYPWMAAVWHRNIESLQHLVNATEASPSSHITPQKVNSFLNQMYHIMPRWRRSRWHRYWWPVLRKRDNDIAACLAAFGHGPLLESFLLQVGSRHCKCQASLQGDKKQSNPCPTMIQSIVNGLFSDVSNTIFWARTAEALEVLLAYGANPNIQDHNGETAVYRVMGENEYQHGMEQFKAICSVQQLQVKLKLPSSRCSIEPTMENGGRIQDVSGVLDPPLAPRFDINVRNHCTWGWTVLIMISGAEPVGSGDLKDISLLLDAFPEVDIHLRDDFGRFALLHTVGIEQAGYRENFDLLLRRYSDSDLHHLNTPDKDGRTIVSYAAVIYPEEEVYYLPVLLAKFPDIALDTPDNKGWTPLRWAVDCDCTVNLNEEIIWFLLFTNKVNPFQGLEGGTSAFTEMKRQVQWCVDEGFDGGWTRFALCTKDILRLMIDIGRDEEIMAQFHLQDEEIGRIQEEVAEAQKLVEDLDKKVENDWVDVEDDWDEDEDDSEEAEDDSEAEEERMRQMVLRMRSIRYMEARATGTLAET